MRSSEVVSGSQELSSTLPDGSVSSELLCSHLQGLQGLPSPTFGFLFTTAGEGAVGAFSPPAAGKHSGTGSGTRPPPPQIQGSFYYFVLPGLQGPPAGSAKALRNELTLRVTPEQMVAMPQEGGIPGAGEHLWAQRWGRGDDGNTDICD